MKHSVVALALLAATLAATASAAVVTFDDLPGENVAVPDGYGGINWGGNWTYYGSVQPPYTPHSPRNRVYDRASEGIFSFVTPDQTFDGAWFAGMDSTTVQFRLYDNGVLVASSAVLGTSATPVFLASGYAGTVDEVRVFSNAPDFFVMDDVTYGTAQAAVPEPSSLAMLAGGLVLLAGRLRKRA
jgi:hypothetical protein